MSILHLQSAVTVTLVALGATGAFASGPFAGAYSQVTVVHGIPGRSVDVYVDGAKTIGNLQPGTVARPLSLPAGRHRIALTRAGEALVAADLQVPGNGDISLVAHLGATGAPVLTRFADDTAGLAAGRARLIVRHTAAAPALDVRAGGRPVFAALTNPNQATADLEPGTVTAHLESAGTRLLGAAGLSLAAGTATTVYAVGSAADRTLGIVTRTVRASRTDRLATLPWSGIGEVSILLGLLALLTIRTPKLSVGAAKSRRPNAR